MSKLIALVHTAVFVDGVRKVIAPGDPLPDDLHEHDQVALTGSGSAEDQEATAKQLKASAAAERKALGAFKAARESVQAAAESIAPPDGDADKS